MSRTVDLGAGFALHTFCPGAGRVNASLRLDGDGAVIIDVEKSTRRAAVTAIAATLVAMSSAALDSIEDD